VAGDILSYASFFFQKEVQYDEKDFEKRLLKPGATDLLRAFRDRLARLEPYDPKNLESALNGFVQEQGIKAAELVHPLRVATTGKGVGPGLYDCLEILGREVCLERIDTAIAKAKTSGVTKS
jgi:glutamyl/glutaminyl-tRNA synthetase